MDDSPFDAYTIFVSFMSLAVIIRHYNHRNFFRCFADAGDRTAPKCIDDTSQLCVMGHGCAQAQPLLILIGNDLGNDRCFGGNTALLDLW
jgi:hypothetical protein